MSVGAGLLAAALYHFLVFGIFPEMSVNVLMSLNRCFSWEVSQMIRRFLTSRNNLLDRSWKQVSHTAEICLFLVTCQTTIVQENWYFLLSINTLFAWRLGVANLITVEILFFLFSRYENLGELCMHFELQVASPWTNLAEVWPNCCQIAYLQNCLRILILLFISKLQPIFHWWWQ